MKTKIGTVLNQVLGTGMIHWKRLMEAISKRKTRKVYKQVLTTIKRDTKLKTLEDSDT